MSYFVDKNCPFSSLRMSVLFSSKEQNKTRTSIWGKLQAYY